jgi:phosphate starvation-inducible PhoH-like protein
MSKKKRLQKDTETSTVTKIDKKDKSPQVWQEESLKWKLNIKQREDYTEKQKIILETMDHKNTRCVLIDGLWGTGKSTLAVLGALKLLNSGRVKKILYVRSPCESSNSATVGILPGSLDERMAAYNAIMMDKLQEMLPSAESKKLMDEGHIEFIPPGLIRGRSFNATAIIVDECSQLSWEDLLLLVSRAGEFTRVFFIGDNYQQDIRNSGFGRFFKTFDDLDSKEHGIFTFELKDKSDIVRSGFLRYVMEKVGTLKYGNQIDKNVPMFPEK